MTSRSVSSSLPSDRLAIQVEAVEHVRAADPRARRGDLLEPIVEGHEPEQILEEHRRQPGGRDRARNRRRNRHRPSTPQRVDSDASATATMAALLSCSNSRVISGLKLVSDDCAQSIDDIRSPGSQSRMPTKLNPRALEHAGMVAERELLHPLQDEELDLGDLLQVDERLPLVHPTPVGRVWELALESQIAIMAPARGR